ncbi:FecR family protein [Horticoccus sp. 23ND18S-11]|uniref:FecR family protein n=1 Tax=Horticoccus sp. 23ND18S-11 TaxID=3391832 RepID=UPI0039C9F33E
MAADEIAQIASRWVARRDAGLDAAGSAELKTWLRADPRHATAFRDADTQASLLDWPLHAGMLDQVLASLAARATQRRARRRKLAQAGAAAAVLALAVVFIYRLPNAAHSNAAPRSLVVRGPEVHLLPDGSAVELQGSADVWFDYTSDARRVELRRGTAHFTVRKDQARPFLVTAGDVTARAVGTAFMVGRESGRVDLLVTEGRVALDREAPASAPQTLAFVQAGESIGVAATNRASEAPRLTALPEDERREKLAWRTPRLEFDRTPLGELVATVNRHNRTRIVLGDPALATVKLSGALSADRIDALLEMLDADFGIGAATDGDKITLRRRIP